MLNLYNSDDLLIFHARREILLALLKSKPFEPIPTLLRELEALSGGLLNPHNNKKKVNDLEILNEADANSQQNSQET